MKFTTLVAFAFLLDAANAHELRGSVDRELSSCTNDAQWEGKDTGCTVDQPICLNEVRSEIGWLSTGTQCYKCINTVDSLFYADMGCTSDKPLCLNDNNSDPGHNKGATQCVSNNFECENTAANAGLDKDCTVDKPLCVGELGQEIDSSCFGFCRKCVNSYQVESSVQPDFGCSASAPKCVKGDNSEPTIMYAGDKCVSTGPPPFCVNDKTGASIDTDCDTTNPICVWDTGYEPPFPTGEGDSCAVCINSSVDPMGTDVGCDVGQICVGQSGEDDLPENKAGTQCVEVPFCINDKSGTQTDNGCSYQTPICFDSNTSMEPSYPDGAGDQCIFCVNDSADGTDTGCDASTPICADSYGNEVGENMLGSKCVEEPFCINDDNTVDGVDTKCSSGTPVCYDGVTDMEPAFPDGPGDTCVVCVNDDPTSGGRDTGCSSDDPLCVGSNGFTVGDGKAGGQCVACVNNKSGTQTDNGCSYQTPICFDSTTTSEPESNEGGEQCIFCVNDSADGTDTGCDASTPICADSYGNEVDPNMLGSKCVEEPFCINDKDKNTVNDVDTGCSIGTPVCYNDVTAMEPVFDDGEGDTCVVCVNDDPTFDGLDTGCSSSHAVCVAGNGDPVGVGTKGGKCIQKPKCVNDKPGKDKDTGCGYSDPICVEDNGQEPNDGQPGTMCAPCIDTKEGNGLDLGCSSEKPQCLNNDDTVPGIPFAGDKCVDPCLSPSNVCLLNKDGTPKKYNLYRFADNGACELKCEEPKKFASKFSQGFQCGQCPPPPPPPPGSNICDFCNKPIRLLLEYTGSYDGTNQQGSKFNIAGTDLPGVSPVDLSLQLKSGEVIARSIAIGDTLLLEGQFNSNTVVTLVDPSSDDVSVITFHTSCSAPIVQGDEYGPLKLIGYEGGNLCGFGL